MNVDAKKTPEPIPRSHCVPDYSFSEPTVPVQHGKVHGAPGFPGINEIPAVIDRRYSSDCLIETFVIPPASILRTRWLPVSAMKTFPEPTTHTFRNVHGRRGRITSVYTLTRV